MSFFTCEHCNKNVDYDEQHIKLIFYANQNSKGSEEIFCSNECVYQYLKEMEMRK